ncbi:MAG: hypothetical protein E3J50_05060 [Dehalococcoidia bacterium]|nr:MAG: hypothetical protein E3J50_05060 [Dehalococcoidia bacterium]
MVGREDAWAGQQTWRRGGRAKALLLAADKDTGLRPLTNTKAKHVLPVGSKPILFHVLDCVIEAGINDIGIVVSPDSDPCVKEAIGDDCRVKLE